MEDKLFCDRVAKGELSKNDILKFAESVEDKVHLCWLLFCRMPSTKTARAETECERLSMAMAWIQTKYGFDWDGEYQDESTIKPTDDEDKATFEALNENRIQSNEPQQDKEKAIEKYVIINKKDMIIQAIKNLVSGKKGKQAAVIIAVAVTDGYINKPTFDILKEAFGITGSRQAFNKAYKMYFEPDKTATEKEPRDRNKAMKLSASYKSQTDAAKAALKRAIEELE